MGTAAFRGWWNELPADVELCLARLPGRDGRLRETPYRNLKALASDIGDGILPLLDAPFAIFGHSMGAWLSFEVARYVRRVASRVPERLLVSGRRAPHVPDKRSPLADLADTAFIEEMRRRYDGIPQVVLEDQELLQLMLPSLRADVMMLESHVHTSEEPFDCPISVFGGIDDAETTEADLHAWCLHTTAAFSVRKFPGGHFFLNSSRPALLSAIAADLGTMP